MSQEELKAAWKTCIEAFRTSGASALVTGALSRACPLALDSSSLRVGICVGDRMTRENLKRHQREVETRLSGILGIQVSLSFEEISAEAAKNSIAQEEKTRREDRERRK